MGTLTAGIVGCVMGLQALGHWTSWTPYRAWQPSQQWGRKFMGFFIVIVLVMVFVVGVAVVRGKKAHEAWTRVAEQEGLRPTPTPCGLTEDRLAALEVCPTGNGEHGLWHGADGRAEIDGATTTPVDVGVLAWWWKEQPARVEHSINETVEHHHAVAVMRLPFHVPHVTIVPEGRLTRLGLTGRDDLQVESEVFNRRFHVERHDTDVQLVVRLLDAEFQRVLVDEFDGRQVELVDDLLVVAGDADDTPPPDEPELRGVVAQLPHARRDVIRLAGALPDAFVRGVT